MITKTYMNINTGSTGTYTEWDYISESGEPANAVDLGEVVEVKRDSDGDWVEVGA